jgi:hypothetical protein
LLLLKGHFPNRLLKVLEISARDKCDDECTGCSKMNEHFQLSLMTLFVNPLIKTDMPIFVS